MGTTSKKGAMCRICLRKKRKFISIFKYSSEFKYTIADLLMACAPLHINSNDEFPKWICTICHNNLKIVYQFRKLAVKSEKKLIEMSNRRDNIAKNVDAKYLEPEMNSANEFLPSENVDVFNSSKINYTTDNLYTPQPQHTSEDIVAETSEDIITSDLNQPLENIQQNIKLEPIEIDFNQFDLQNCLTDNETIVKIENTSVYECNTNDASEFQRELKEEYSETCTETNRISNNTNTAVQDGNEHSLPLYPNIKFDEAEFQQYAAGNCSNSELAESYILYDTLNRTTAKKRSPKNSLMYQCKVCKQLFFDCQSKNKHMEIHKKYYKCETCDRTFIKWSGFLAHRRRHNRVTPYLCSVCDTYYPKKHSLTLHLQTHTNERPFKCDQCMKSFRSKSQMLGHKRWDKCQPVVCIESV